MASKETPVSKSREEAAAAKPFPTFYYNHGIHAAAMAVSAFINGP